ncbi:MAG: hypothetical protein JWM16_6378 [Verrucomicrobiales bacterium]|nr:hypothetical protein [Verrucomicrobiales bacterium]
MMSERVALPDRAYGDAKQNKVINNVRPDLLQATIRDWTKAGWTVVGHPVVPGDVGYTFTLMLIKEQK